MHSARVCRKRNIENSFRFFSFSGEIEGGLHHPKRLWGKNTFTSQPRFQLFRRNSISPPPLAIPMNIFVTLSETQPIHSQLTYEDFHRRFIVVFVVEASIHPNECSRLASFRSWAKTSKTLSQRWIFHCGVRRSSNEWWTIECRILKKPSKGNIRIENSYAIARRTMSRECAPHWMENQPELGETTNQKHKQTENSIKCTITPRPSSLADLAHRTDEMKQFILNIRK